MSLSNPQETPDAKYSGKVVISCDAPGPDEMSIKEIEGKRQLLWDDSTNDEYLERVKEKAKEKAKEIMMFAELEAEALRAQARIEGYETGIAQAQEELQQHTENMTMEVQNMLSNLGAHGSVIWRERRQDIMTLIRLAVEKTINVELSEKRMQSMEALLNEALERIEKGRQIVIRCSVLDAEDMEGFLTQIQERDPSLKYWSVKSDINMEPGGMIVETPEGKVDNTVASRWQEVEPILDQLATQMTAEQSEEG